MCVRVVDYKECHSQIVPTFAQGRVPSPRDIGESMKDNGSHSWSFLLALRPYTKGIYWNGSYYYIR